MLLVSYAIAGLAWWYGSLGLLFGVLTGSVFLGPLLALTLYSISDQLQSARQPRVSRAIEDAARVVGDALVFAVALLVVFLVWARAASMVHIFVPSDGSAQGTILFLFVGTAVGALFAAIVFTASAFSLPMLVDRKADTITAVVTSVNAVLRNKRVMAVWATLIVLITLLGFATAFLGFLVLLPLVGFATWHAYRETIDSEQWPPQERDDAGPRALHGAGT